VFRIRRIQDSVLPYERSAIEQVQAILRDQFPLLSEDEVAKLPDQLADPVKHRFRTILLVGDDARGHVRGFATVLHMPDVRACVLDFLSAGRELTRRGIGGALYVRVREEAALQGAVALFFEALPDDPRLCSDPAVLRANAARLRFYESFGARPVVGTAYETPLTPQGDCPPYLVVDELGRDQGLARETVRPIVRAFLERKYGTVCPRGYIDSVVRSFRDDPLRLREPRYGRSERPAAVAPASTAEQKIVVVVNDKHRIHHVRERGYIESPARVDRILKEIEKTGLVERLEPRHFGDEFLKHVHDADFVGYLKRVCGRVPEGESVYPYVFPIRNAARKPVDLPVRAGYYCIDTFTPLNAKAWPAARRAVDCALTAARTLIDGGQLAYALVRPPGHHAERRVFGGFCYLNSAAVAAHDLSRYARVAVLDLDYHHGNGTQDIFYERSDVLTASIHGHPRFAYPYFSGFADELGAGPGEGFNLNVPLPEHVDGPRYREALGHVLRRIARFDPRFLVVALGLDTARDDPTGTWSLQPDDFREIGHAIGALGRAVLVVQEGGYNARNLGPCARSFVEGLWGGTFTRGEPDGGDPGRARIARARSH
jgi:acetoin utilization deacetylase AcuC-like enzyme/GNAT superfamily N-acetyltransferase